MKVKKNIGIMYAIAFLQGMVFYGAIATLYRQAAGISVFQITVIESISLALALVLELPWGILAEKIGYKKTMILCCIIYFFSKIIFWKADGFGLFLLERILLAVVIAGMSGVDESVIYLSCQKEEVHKVFSIYSTLGTAGLIAAAGCYNIFMHGSYHLAGLATVITYGVAMICSLFLEEVKPAEKSNEHPIQEFLEILKSIRGEKNLIFFLIGVALFSECNQTITVFLNQLQFVRAGMTDKMIGWTYIAVTIAGMIGIRSAALVKQLGKKKAGILLFGMAGLACFTLMVTSNALLSILAVLMLRVAFSLMMPLEQVMQNQLIKHKNRATALSINAVIMDMVAISTNLIFGKVSDMYLPLAFGVGTIFCVIGMILFLYATRK